MLRSMTACGRGTLDYQGAHYSVEIQAVNRKHLDIQTHLPRILSSLDADIRHAISEKISRGQVSVRLQVSFHAKDAYKVIPNLALAEEIKKAWDEVGSKLGLGGFTLDFLKDSPDILTLELSDNEEKSVKDGAVKALSLALDELVIMKSKEGKALKKDFLNRLETIEKAVDEIQVRSADAPQKWGKKISDRLKEVGESPELDERIAREIALMSEKMDITEECVRFHSHATQYRDYMDKPGSFGKTLEFILQEFGREINTIGSKSQDVEISKLVILVKTEIERMREQIQNVE